MNTSTYTKLIIVAMLGLLTGCPSGGGSGSVGPAPVPNNVPRFAYVADWSKGSVSTYVVDASTGRIKYIGKIIAGTNPVSVALDPSGKYAYVAHWEVGGGIGKVSQFTIGTDGSLTSMATPQINAGDGPRFVTVDPTGRFVYVANYASNNISQFKINLDGSLLPIATTTSQPMTGPFSISVDSGGKYAYVANYDGDSVSIFSINSTSGVLTQIDADPASPNMNIPAGSSPSSIAIDPSGTHAYVTNFGGNTLSQYTINQMDGSLSAMADAPTNTGPRSIAIDPSGSYAYVSNWGSTSSVGTKVSKYKIDPLNGTLTAFDVFDAGARPIYTSVDPSGKFVFVANEVSDDISLFMINPANGNLSSNSPSTIAAQGAPISIAISHGTAAVFPVPRYAYVANAGSLNLDVSKYTIDPINGSLMEITNPVNSGDKPVSVTADPSRKFVYVANQTSSDISGFLIDAANGELTKIICGTAGTIGCSTSDPTNFAAGLNPNSVTVDPSGKYAYVANYGAATISAYTINSTSGALTQIDANASTTTIIDNFPAGVRPASVAVDPSGKYAYSANHGTSDISAYMISSATGALTRIICGSSGTSGCGTSDPANFAAINQPTSVVADPSGQFVYVTNSASGIVQNVSQYKIDLGGRLSPMIPSTVDALNGSGSIFITTDSIGKFVYVANEGDDNISQFQIEPLNGTLSLVNTVLTANLPHSITLDPSGEFAYVTNFGADSIWWYKVDQINGTLNMTNATAGPPGIGPNSITTIGTYQ